MAIFGSEFEDGKKALDQLADLHEDLWDVVGDCLKAYKEHMMDEARSQCSPWYDVDDMDLELLLCVPQTRKDLRTQQTFRAVAQRATDAKLVRLVPEAVCAAAFITTESGRFGGCPK